MEKDNIDVSIYETAEKILEDVLKSDFKGKDKVYEYLNLLKTIKQEQAKLDSSIEGIAAFNEAATAYIVYFELDKAIKENMDYAMVIIDKEIVRLKNVISEYKSGNIKPLSYDNMENILMEYSTDDVALFDTLNVLYSNEITDDDVIKELVYI